MLAQHGAGRMESKRRDAPLGRSVSPSPAHRLRGDLVPQIPRRPNPLGLRQDGGVDQSDGGWRRHFENRLVVYIPPGKSPVFVQTALDFWSLGRGKVSSSHFVVTGDGDILPKSGLEK
jgi:hypothetical protein